MRIAFGITLLLVFFGVSCSKEPKACIEVDKTSVAVNADITFTSCSENALSYIWSFNGPDGASANSIQRSEGIFTFQFDTAGVYNIHLQAFYRYGWLGSWDSTSTNITVQ